VREGGPKVSKMRDWSGFKVKYSGRVCWNISDLRPSISIQFASTDVLQPLVNFFSPFRLMKDVSRGSFEERAAAYRHNRSMRGHLSACMLRWAASCSVAMLLTAWFDAMGGGAAAPGTPSIFVLLAAACATFIACGVCVLSLTAYVYFFLAHNDF
jgi:hypothetical protein